MKSSDAIVDFLKNETYIAYQADPMMRSAVERQLQNLTEAAFRLGVNAEKLCPEVDWGAVRGLGNVPHHEYDEIQDAVIWEAIPERLPLLRRSVRAALAILTNSGQTEP